MSDKLGKKKDWSVTKTKARYVSKMWHCGKGVTRINIFYSMCCVQCTLKRYNRSSANSSNRGGKRSTYQGIWGLG